ncbi:MAG: excalibur calcium-binding domain-containing protein [Thermomicrobiales bacterium]|nr:excalibur calcium-binding domain-containing protein [Thermomicrobiales bacterium]
MTIWSPLLRSTSVMLGACALCLLGGGGVALANTGVDYDCTDFDSRGDAQAFYEATGGPAYDPYNLDNDNDGRACEEWAGEYRKSAAGADGINGEDGLDRDCADFADGDEAQEYFLADGGSSKQNVDHLDPNHNGVACEISEPG